MCYRKCAHARPMPKFPLVKCKSFNPDTKPNLVRHISFRNSRVNESIVGLSKYFHPPNGAMRVRGHAGVYNDSSPFSNSTSLLVPCPRDYGTPNSPGAQPFAFSNQLHRSSATQTT